MPPQAPAPPPAPAPRQVVSKKEESKTRPKLNHPNDLSTIPENVLVTDAEDDNIAGQDLNDDEIEELKNQLEGLRKNQKQQVTAVNDEDDDDDEDSDEDDSD
jgi:hypothetical protein